MRKVAITGSLSSGKSSVCREFNGLGAYVVNADEIVHQSLSSDQHLGQQIITLLGNRIIVNGKIDRNAIANIVFKDKTLLRSLEKLIHPIVLNEIEEKYQHISNQGKASLFIAEIPLLFEAGLEKNFNSTIAVWADPDVCKKRFIAATGCGADEYIERMSNQMPPEEKAKRADYVIDNSGNMEQMRQAVVNLFIKLTAETNS